MFRIAHHLTIHETDLIVNPVNATLNAQCEAGAAIETASLRDLGPLRRLEQISFPKDAWPLLDLIGVLTFGGVVRLKAVCDGQMVGFIAGDVRRMEGVAWIATVAVLPEYRGQGDRGSPAAGV